MNSFKSRPTYKRTMREIQRGIDRSFDFNIRFENLPESSILRNRSIILSELNRFKSRIRQNRFPYNVRSISFGNINRIRIASRTGLRLSSLIQNDLPSFSGDFNNGRSVGCFLYIEIFPDEVSSFFSCESRSAFFTRERRRDARLPRSLRRHIWKGRAPNRVFDFKNRPSTGSLVYCGRRANSSADLLCIPVGGRKRVDFSMRVRWLRSCYKELVIKATVFSM